MDRIFQHYRRLSSRAVRDIVFYLIFVVVGAWLSVRFGLFERFTDWSRNQEAHLLSIIAMFIVAGLAVFGWRRWRESVRVISRHVETLEELRVSEGRFQALLTGSPDLMFRVDRDGSFLAVKESEALTMPAETIIGKNVCEVLPPALAEQASDVLRQINAGSGEVMLHCDIAGQDGPVSWEVRYVPVVDSEEVLIIARDITDSKTQTEAYRDLDERFRAAFEDASIGMALTSATGQFMLTNQALCQLLGYSKEELAEMKFADITHPDDLADSDAKRQELAVGMDSVVQWEKRYIHADGHAVWVQMNVAPVRDSEGKISYHLSQVQDITDRQEAQALLAASEHRWKQTFQSAPAGVGLVNVESGRLLTVNQAGCDMFGYSEQEMLTRTLGELTHPDDRDESVARLRRVITGEIPSSHAKLRYLRNDGSTGHALVAAALLEDPGDSPLRLVVHFVDITDRVAAEQRLADLLAAKDQLIASVSHELRTPLTAVVGYAHLLNDEASGLSPAERKEMTASIVSQGTDLANIIEDLLVEARADTDTLTLARVPVDIRAQTAQVLENLDAAARVELVGPSPRALADPARVRQIIRNLITNALRYGGDRIQARVEDTGSSVRLIVSDNGPGVPLEEQDLIFAPYHRAHTSKGLTASVGLGLTVSRRLAILMDGDLAYRHENRECIFQLDLPRVDPQASLTDPSFLHHPELTPTVLLHA
jgi:PAS domain S-box-containing protein